MKIEKIHLDDMKRCYCASHMIINGKPYALLASEDPQTCCYAYSGEGFRNRETVWDDRGGCMSIIQIPGKEDEFLAVNEFYLKVSPSQAKLVHGKRNPDGTWTVKDFLSLPFLHRFDIYNVNGVNYLICATIALDKFNKEDWSRPGQIYVARLTDDFSQPVELEKIADGMFRNHGCSRAMHNGKICGYFGSDQGVVRVTPPYDGRWHVEKIFDGHVGEIAFGDLDGDGVDEMMTIEPFHGDTIKIYRLVNGKYEEVFKYENPIDFAHSLIFDTLAGKKTFLAGIRRVDAELFAVQYVDGKYEVTVIDKGFGPSNLDVIHAKDADYIVAANHTGNEAALYRITD